MSLKNAKNPLYGLIATAFGITAALAARQSSLSIITAVSCDGLYPGRDVADLAQLTAWRDALMAARYQGIRTVEYDGNRVTYASDAEMAAALGDLKRQITGTIARIFVVCLQSSKGLWP